MDAAGEARLMKAIIPQRDEIQERKILVIYYIELRTRYFNHFAMRIFDILLYISLPISQSKEVEKIYALSKQPTQWTYSKWGVKNDIQREHLDMLFKQAKRRKTNTNNVIRIYNVDGVVRQATIAESEIRKGLFPDDGLFKLFKPLTDKDIRAKIVAENKRITSFLTIIENILVACVAEYAEFKATFETIKDTFNKAKDRFETFSRATNITSEKRSSRFSLSSSKKIAPASSPTSPTSHTLFDYSQNDLHEFITITDAVFDSVDIIAYYLKDIKNVPLIEQTIKQIKDLLSNREEYITLLSELITVYKFKSTTFPVRYSQLVNYYDELMKPKVAPKTPKVSPKPKPHNIKYNRDYRDNRNMEYKEPNVSPELPLKYRKKIEHKVSGGRIPKIPKNKPKDTKKPKDTNKKKPVKPVKQLRRQRIRLRLP